LEENKLGIFSLSGIPSLQREFYELINKIRKKTNRFDILFRWLFWIHGTLTEIKLFKFERNVFAWMTLCYASFASFDHWTEKVVEFKFSFKLKHFFLKNNIKTNMLFEMKLLSRFKVFLQAKLLVYNSAFVSTDC
jgi:hypothetical protein